jgi:hypothetical protein
MRPEDALELVEGSKGKLAQAIREGLRCANELERAGYMREANEIKKHMIFPNLSNNSMHFKVYRRMEGKIFTLKHT